MLTVCLQCGDRGDAEALIYCGKCGEYALHGYCLDVIPENFDEEVTWFCEDCKPDVPKQLTLDKPSSLSRLCVSIEPKKVQSNQSKRRLKKNQKVTTGPVGKTKFQAWEGRPSGKEAQCNEDQNLRKRRILVFEEEASPPRNSQVPVSEPNPLNVLQWKVITSSAANLDMCDAWPSDNWPPLREKCDKNQKPKKKQGLVLEDEGAKPLKTSQAAISKDSNILQKKVITGYVPKSSLIEPWCKKQHINSKLKRPQRLLRDDDEAEPLKTSQVADGEPSNILEQKGLTSSVAKIGVQKCDSSPSGNEPQCKKNCDKDQKLKRQQVMVLEDKGAEPLKTSRDAISNASNMLLKNVITGSEAKMGVQMCDKISPHGEPLCNKKRVEDLKRQQRLLLDDEEAQPLKTSQVADSEASNILEQNAVTSSVAKIGVHMCDSKPSESEPQCRKKCDMDHKVKKQQRLFLEDEEAEPSETAHVAVSDRKPSDILQHSYVEAQPILDPIWKGTFSTKTVERLVVVAHLSNLACPKVCEVVKLLPQFVLLELSTRSHLWPRSFQHWGPSCESIGLFFFPDNRRDERVFDSLVNDMIQQDLAMRAVLENAELLVFTSYILPMHYWRFQAKYYLWGVFRSKKASHPTNVAFGGEKAPCEVSTHRRPSPMSPLSQSGSYSFDSLHSYCESVM